MPNLGKNQNFLTADELIERWEISPQDLLIIMESGELPFYDAKTLRNWSESAWDERFLTTEMLNSYVFDVEDIISFEKANPQYKPKDENAAKGAIDAKDKRKLGQLEREKENWDRSIEATARVMDYCHKKKDILTRTQFHKFLDGVGYKTLPDSTREKIWKSLPSKYRKGPGRPRKKDDNH